MDGPDLLARDANLARHKPLDTRALHNAASELVLLSVAPGPGLAPDIQGEGVVVAAADINNVPQFLDQGRGLLDPRGGGKAQNTFVGLHGLDGRLENEGKNCSESLL